MDHAQANQYTYFIQAKCGGPVKIGYTTGNPKHRLRDLQTGSPSPLVLIGYVRGNVERQLHKQFASDRVHGEWFALSSAVKRFIEHDDSFIALCAARNRKRVKLLGKPVQITDALSTQAGPSWFDYCIPNDEDLFDKLSISHDWECDGKECACVNDYENKEYEDAACELSVIENICSFIADKPFFESVGINKEQKWMCFNCGPCISRSRMASLEGLSSFACDFNFLASEWFLFALFMDGDKQIAINLQMLNLNLLSRGKCGGGVEYIFDVSTLIKNLEGTCVGSGTLHRDARIEPQPL